MGYWENTTYVNTGDPALVIQALDSIFSREGMQRIAVPQSRQRHDYEPMRYAGALGNDTWGVAAFPGAPSWTVVKTAPLELLGERAAGAAKMRLVDLCRALSVPAFQVNVYDGTATLLCEVSEHGDVYLSGYTDTGDPLEWHDETLSEEFVQAQFRLLPYQNLLSEAFLGDDFAFALSAAFGGNNSEQCNNGPCGDLITHSPVLVESSVVAYFAWPGTSRVVTPPCSWEEWRRRENEAQQTVQGPTSPPSAGTRP